MIHVMKLKKQYFDYIKYGTKKFEIRLNDEKRKKIKKGDYIEFQKEPLLEEKIIVKVEDLYYYNNFSELFNDIKFDYLADPSIQKENLNRDLELFYPRDLQKKFGVVAIKLKKDIIVSCSNLKNIPLNSNIFDLLRENYNNFDSWFIKMQSNNINAFYTEKKNKLTSIMILKLNEIDSDQFFLPGNIMKIRTLMVSDKNKGIGSTYLKIVDEIAISNNINYIYLTIKVNNQELINFIEKRGYKIYNKINDEFVYYKEIR